MNHLEAVILAAGKGTRMKSDLPKVLHQIEGRPMVHYAIQAAKDAGADRVIVVVGYRAALVKHEITDVVDYAEQPEQLGTGHAVMCAESLLDPEGDTMILCGDTPLITADTLRKLLQTHRKEANGVTVLSAKFDNPAGYGRIIRNAAGAFQAIIEDKDCTEEQRKCREINSGMYVFNTEALKASLSRITNQNAQGEYYLTDTIRLIKNTGLKCDAMPVTDSREILGVNTPEQLAEAEKIMQEQNSQ